MIEVPVVRGVTILVETSLNPTDSVARATVKLVASTPADQLM